MHNGDFTNITRAFVDAEEYERKVREYWDNLPADQAYDLGTRVSLSWSASAHKEGHEAVEYWLNRRLRERVRAEIEACLADAVESTKQAKQALLDFARTQDA